MFWTDPPKAAAVGSAAGTDDAAVTIPLSEEQAEAMLALHESIHEREHLVARIAELEAETRVGTCSIDPETGEHVMAPDFPGDEELRWTPDTAPVDDVKVTSCPECGSVTDIDYGDNFAPVPHDPEHFRRMVTDYQTNRDLSEPVPPDNLPDNLPDNQMAVPLATQISEYGTLAEDVLDALAANLAEPWFRREVIRVGAERLLAGYEDYGDEGYHWDVNRRDDEMFEELADYVVYGTMGDFFDVRRKR